MFQPHLWCPTVPTISALCRLTRPSLGAHAGAFILSLLALTGAHTAALAQTDAAASISEVPGGLSRLVIYNALKDAANNPGLVRVNSAYTGVVHQGHHTVICLPPQTATVSLHPRNPPPDEIDMGLAVTLDLRANETHFVRITHTDNEPFGLEDILAVQAAQEIHQAPKELHTRNRLKDSSPCAFVSPNGAMPRQEASLQSSTLR